MSSCSRLDPGISYHPSLIRCAGPVLSCVTVTTCTGGRSGFDSSLGRFLVDLWGFQVSDTQHTAHAPEALLSIEQFYLLHTACKRARGVGEPPSLSAVVFHFRSSQGRQVIGMDNSRGGGKHTSTSPRNLTCAHLRTCWGGILVYSTSGYGRLSSGINASFETA